MSGYLEVKYPLKPNLALNPFKSWKRQWCILRPSAMMSGGSLAVYCSEAGATAGLIDLPSGSIVRRTKSRTRPYAFAVFHVDERKPRVLLAAQSLHDAQSWMDKIKALLNGDNFIGTETLLKDCFSITIIPTELSSKMGLYGDGTLSVSTLGVQFARTHNATFIEWRHIRDVALTMENTDKICILSVDSDNTRGGGELKLSSPEANNIYTAVRSRRYPGNKFSKSEGDLRSCSDIEVRRSSWYSGPSEVSLDDLDLIMSKESTLVPVGQLSRCAGAGELSRVSRARLHSCTLPATSFDDSMSDRRSLLSVASGIYEEIPELPANELATEPAKEPATYCQMGRDVPDGVLKEAEAEEPTYESVSECAYASMRAARCRPPPLPPRLPFGTTKMNESWNSRINSDEPVTRHNSLGSLPRCCSRDDRPAAHAAHSAHSAHSAHTATLPHPTHHKSRSFSVFRKRLKSDSRIASSPKSDTSKENKDIETKKKKFDFTPTRDIFKNFKVNRKMKNLKITSGSLGKGETKSCEFLDETEHVTTNRCSKSVECLEDEFLDEFDGDLSIEFNDDAVAALALPQEIVDLILRSREQFNKIRLKDVQESDYLPMSPIIPPPPIEHHYIVMSPKTNLA